MFGGTKAPGHMNDRVPVQGLTTLEYSSVPSFHTLRTPALYQIA